MYRVDLSTDAKESKPHIISIMIWTISKGFFE